MATGRDAQSWSGRGLIRRDFRQDHGGGPEVPTKRPRKKAGPWCKKEGREHRWDKTVAHEWTDSYGSLCQRYTWHCKSCGKKSWSEPRPLTIPQHKHDYSGTKVVAEWWDDYSRLYEVCVICGKEGDNVRVENGGYCCENCE